ncbi:hypothetical protein FRC08_016365 [Ceratobasidium sp. 394]|nr:hypothetical protein FRC08_016365 [Ceratobasidium sp. 394]
MPVGPMHWTKNICEKQLRFNMGWNWEHTTGVPAPPDFPRPVSDLEYEWGLRALYRLESEEFLESGLTSGLVHYLCRKLGIFEAGLSVEALLPALNQWPDH